jgi:hypothetical protein
MISRKMKLLSVAIGAAALIATPALARTVHKQAPSASQAYASADQAYGANTVVGLDGKVIGRDPDANIRFQLLREGLLDAN